MKLKKLSSKKVALIASFAALIAAVSRLPGIPIMVGVKSGTIEFTVPLYPIAGLLFGPFVGALAALIGNIVAFLIPKWSVFGLLTIPAGALSALVAGFLVNREKFDWRVAAVVLGVLIGLWYVPFPNPQHAYAGLEAPYYPVPLHFSALALILIFRDKIADFINSATKRIMTLGVGLVSYVGIMADHAWGNLMFAYLFFPYYVDLKGFRDFIRAVTGGGKWLIGMGFVSQKTVLTEASGIGDYFMIMLPLSVVERLIFTAFAIIIGVAVIKTVGNYLQVFGVTPLKTPSSEPSAKQG